jgi:hypothetical protein
VSLGDDLPQLGLRRVRVDGSQREPTALAGEHPVELLALVEGQDVEHPDRALLVVDRVAVDDDVVLVERVPGLLAAVDVAEHVP